MLPLAGIPDSVVLGMVVVVVVVVLDSVVAVVVVVVVAVVVVVSGTSVGSSTTEGTDGTKIDVYKRQIQYRSSRLAPTERIVRATSHVLREARGCRSNRKAADCLLYTSRCV